MVNGETLLQRKGSAQLPTFFQYVILLATFCGEKTLFYFIKIKNCTKKEHAVNAFCGFLTRSTSVPCAC